MLLQGDEDGWRTGDMDKLKGAETGRIMVDEKGEGIEEGSRVGSRVGDLT